MDNTYLTVCSGSFQLLVKPLWKQIKILQVYQNGVEYCSAVHLNVCMRQALSKLANQNIIRALLNLFRNATPENW
jgi:hypothetical protein